MNCSVISWLLKNCPKLLGQFIKLNLLILFILTMSSCITELEDEKWKINNEIVVINCIFKNSEEIKLYVSVLENIFSNKISDSSWVYNIDLIENDEIVSTFSKVDSFYWTRYIPTCGRNYRITIDNSIIASTTVPQKPELIIVQHTMGEMFDQSGDPIAEAKIIIKDDESEDNYYELMIYQGYTDRSYYALDYTYYYQVDDPVLKAEGFLDQEYNSFYFSDQLFNGSTHEFRIKYRGYFTYSGDKIIPHGAFLVLRSISKEYYLFLKSWNLHYYNQNIHNHVDYLTEDYDFLTLLFQGEPVDLYSNINGGHGIFAGYSEVVKNFEFVEYFDE